MRLMPVLLATVCISTCAAAKSPRTSPITMAESAVRDIAKDPDSVRFRDVKLDGTCDGIQYVEGRVNAKNGYGGYRGFTIFLARIEGHTATVMQAFGTALDSDDQFKKAATCNGA